MRESHCVVSKTLCVDKLASNSWSSWLCLLNFSLLHLHKLVLNMLFFFTWPTAFQLHVYHNFFIYVRVSGRTTILLNYSHLIFIIPFTTMITLKLFLIFVEKTDTLPLFGSLSTLFYFIWILEIFSYLNNNKKWNAPLELL